MPSTGSLGLHANMGTHPRIYDMVKDSCSNAGFVCLCLFVDVIAHPLHCQHEVVENEVKPSCTAVGQV